VLKRAGFLPPERLRIPDDRILERSIDDLVAWVYSLSSSAPHHFGADLAAFENDLRSLLRNASPSELFAEPVPETEVFIWRKP
jgi:hypothetical protein